MEKALIFDKEHPNGYICDVADEFFEDNTVANEVPAAEERLEALEKAMLDMIKGGVGNA